MARKNVITKCALYLLYAIICLFFLFPVLWVVSYSFKTIPELFTATPRLLPEAIQFENYKYVIENTKIVQNIGNTFCVVIATMLGTLVVTLPAAYVFSRYNFWAKTKTMFIILVFQMISPIVIAIPLYNYLGALGGSNSLMVLTLIYIAISIPMATINIKSYLDSIPRAIDEAARIDACSNFGILTRIHIPISLSGIVSVCLMVMVTLWGQFVVPFVLMNNSSKFPVSVGLINLQSSSEAITTHYLSAACVLGIIPTTIIFIVLQRYIVSAMTAGSVKE